MVVYFGKLANINDSLKVVTFFDNLSNVGDGVNSIVDKGIGSF